MILGPPVPVKTLNIYFKGRMSIHDADRTSFRIMEDPPMPAVFEFATIVKEALEEFSDVFANEPERTHFSEYLTGLLTA